MISGSHGMDQAVRGAYSQTDALSPRSKSFNERDKVANLTGKDAVSRQAFFAQLFEGAEIEADLFSPSGDGTTHGPAEFFRALNFEARQKIRKQFGAEFIEELNCLAAEPNSEMFWQGALQLGIRLEQSDRLEAAAGVYSALATPHPPLSGHPPTSLEPVAFGGAPPQGERGLLNKIPSPLAGEGGRRPGEGSVPPNIQHKALQLLNAIQGIGSAGIRTEFLLRRFSREATEPATLFGMGAASAVFRVTRLAALSRLLSAGSGWWTRGAGAQAAAGLIGFGAEATVFPLATRFGHLALGRELKWGASQIAHELASSYIVLGAMKLTGWSTARAISTVGARHAVPLRYGSTAAVQTGMLGGILLGHRLEQAVGLRPRLDGATTLTDSLAMLLQFNVGGRLTGSMLGPRYHAWERELDWRSRGFQQGPRSTEWMDSSLVPVGISKLPSTSVGRSEILLMSSVKEDGPSSGVPIPRPPTNSGAIRVQGNLALQKLPEIRRSLLPQIRDQLASTVGLEFAIGQHLENLRKLDQTIGDESQPGAAPFVGRLLADTILQGGKEVSLADHPVANLVASALAAHYEALGDPLGNRIYRDLMTVYGMLSNGKEKKFLQAEEIILQNLELDPFNPWFIQLGREVSRNLKELAAQKPPYYDELWGVMVKLPEKWKESALERSIEEKIVGKFRKKFLRAAWEQVSWFGLVAELVMPVFQAVSGIFLGPVHLLRYLGRVLKLGNTVRKAPTILETIRKKTSFEISLYYGDFRGAQQYAEPGSKLLIISELLRREQMGQVLERRINLEAIPQLSPFAVPQVEALAELEKKLKDASVLGLEGFAGSSKTFVAVQLANKYRNDPDRPVFWYTFKEGKKPDMHRAFDHLAHFLKLQNQESGTEKLLLANVQGQSTTDAKSLLLKEALNRTPAILFFDNFHLVMEDAEASQVFRQLVSEGFLDTKVITISRRGHDWLKEIGGQIFTKGELTFPEARQLFDNLGVLNRLSEEQMVDAYLRSHGRPMSLTLMGELLRSESPKAVENILAELEGKSRPEALKYLFDRIYNGLTSQQQSLLQYLSIFREPFTQGALAFFGPAGGESGQYLLIPLLEVFLVEERQPGLFELHEKFKRLAALHLQDHAELHRRAAEYYRARASAPSDFLEAAYHYQKAGELEQAARMISRRTTALLKNGYLDRVEEVLHQFPDAIQLRPTERAAIYSEKADLAQFKRDWELALDYLKKALEIRRRRKDLEGMILIYNKIGNIHDLKGQRDKAVSYFEKALSLAEKQDDPKGLSQIYHDLGMVYQNAGNFNSANDFYQQSLTIKKTLGDREGMANTLFNLGLLERDRYNAVKAVDYLREAYELYRQLEAPEIREVERVLKEL